MGGLGGVGEIEKWGRKWGQVGKFGGRNGGMEKKMGKWVRVGDGRSIFLYVPRSSCINRNK